MAISSDSGTWTVAWPWPRVFNIDNYLLAVAPVSSNLYLYEFYKVASGNDWNAVELLDLGIASEIDYISIAQVQQFYLISVIGKDGSTNVIGSWQRVPGTFGEDATHTIHPTTYVPTHSANCTFNGQLLIGGIVNNVETIPWNDFNLSTIAWAGIGGVDFRSSKDNPFYKTTGYRQIPWARNSDWESSEHSGIIHAMKQLGNSVIVYGNFGIASISPVSQPIFTYSLQDVQSLGIRSGNHIAGDSSIHGFIDNYNDFWVVKPGNIPTYTKLGYREFMTPLFTDPGGGRYDTIVTYLPEFRRFYISNGQIGYVLTEFGLYSTNQLTTSVIYTNSGLFGFWADSADYKIRIMADTLNFNQRGHKTLTTVEFDGHYLSTNGGNARPLECAIQYKSDHQTKTFTESSWTPINNKGVSSKRITASDFRVGIRCEDYRDSDSDFDIKRLKIKMQFVDKHNLRGRREING